VSPEGRVCRRPGDRQALNLSVHNSDETSASRGIAEDAPWAAPEPAVTLAHARDGWDLSKALGQACARSARPRHTRGQRGGLAEGRVDEGGLCRRGAMGLRVAADARFLTHFMACMPDILAESSKNTPSLRGAPEEIA